MTEERNSYVLFDYLYYFWKNKKWLFVIPGTFMIVGLLIGLFQPTTYTGDARIPVNETNPNLVEPDIVQNRYGKLLPEDMKTGFTVTVPQMKRIQLVLTGQDENQVKQEFDKVITQYQVDLKKSYEERLQIVSKYLDAQEDNAESMSKTLTKLEKVTGDNKEDLQALLKGQSDMFYANEQVELLRNDRKNLEQEFEPVNVNFKRNPSPIVPNIIIALALGLLLTVAGLMLKKYISDAKANRSAS